MGKVTTSDPTFRTDIPLVGGLVERDDQNRYRFTYGRRYLAHYDAISLFPDELSLQPGIHQVQVDGARPSRLRAASPDAWGRRVIINRLPGQKGDAADGVDFNELVYLLESASDRIGALDYQQSSTDYCPQKARPPPWMNWRKPRPMWRQESHFLRL